MHKLANRTKKLSKKPNAYDISTGITNTTPTGQSQLHSLQNNHTLSLTTQNYRNTLSIDERMLDISNLQRSPISHTALQQTTIDDLYKQIVEQPDTLTFRSQNNHLFSPRWAAKLDPSIFPFPIDQISNATVLSVQFQTSPPPLTQ